MNIGTWPHLSHCQMVVYRARVGDVQPSVPQPEPREHPGAIPSLAAQFGLDEMELEEERLFQGESIDNEFFRYSNAALTQRDIDILNFWAVGTVMPYK